MVMKVVVERDMAPIEEACAEPDRKTEAQVRTLAQKLRDVHVYTCTHCMYTIVVIMKNLNIMLYIFLQGCNVPEEGLSSEGEGETPGAPGYMYKKD